MTCQFLTIFYGPKEAPGVKELGQKRPEPSTRVESAPTPLGALLSRGQPGGPLDMKPTPKIPINIETFGN